MSGGGLIGQNSTTTVAAPSSNSIRLEDDVEFDVSINFCCWLTWIPCTFGLLPYKTILHLGREEVSKTDVDCCGQNESKRPYGELGNVDRSTCCCFVSFDSTSFGGISPGCGCDPEKVDRVVYELKRRIRLRGDAAQIQRAEETIRRLDEMESKLDLIMEHLKIPKPDKMVDRGAT